MQQYVTIHEGSATMTGRGLSVAQVTQPYLQDQVKLSSLMRRYDLTAAQMHAAIAYQLDPACFDTLTDDRDIRLIGDQRALYVAYVHLHTARTLDETASKTGLSLAQVHLALSCYYTENPDEDNDYDVNMHEISMKALDDRANPLPGLSALTSLATLSAVNTFGALVFAVGAVLYGVNNPAAVQGWLESLGIGGQQAEAEIRETTQPGSVPNLFDPAYIPDLNFDTDERETPTAADSCTLTVRTGANVRRGPGLAYGVVDSESQNARLTTTGYCQSGGGLRWYALAGGGWVREDTVNAARSCGELARVQNANCNRGDASGGSSGATNPGSTGSQPAANNPANDAPYFCEDLRVAITNARQASTGSASRSAQASQAALNEMLGTWQRSCYPHYGYTP